MGKWPIKWRAARRAAAKLLRAFDWRRGAIMFALASLAIFLLLNASYFSKRLQVAMAPEPVATVVSPRAPEDAVLLGLLNQPDRLLIPRLLIDAPLVRVTERSESAYQAALREGVAHFPGTAEAGQTGNAYYFGHSSDFPLSPGDYKTVFAALTDAVEGDAIYITDASGNAYRYTVTSTQIVEPDDLSVLDQSDKTKRMLTLQTSYPIGTALRRFLVIAELADGLLVR